MYEKFEKIINQRKMTAYQVAKGTGLSTGFFSDWKNGRYSPKIAKLKKIATYLGVSVDELTNDKE